LRRASAPFSAPLSGEETAAATKGGVVVAAAWALAAARLAAIRTRVIDRM
jgi:hypothetical protein